MLETMHFPLSEEEKQRRKDLRKAILKAYFPKKSIVFWVIVAFWVLYLFLNNIRSAKIADFIQNYTFPIYAETVGRFFGWIDVNVDTMIAICIGIFSLTALATIILIIIRLAKHRSPNKIEVILFYSVTIFTLMAVHCFWYFGFSYQISPLNKKMGFEVWDYSYEEMKEYSDWLVEKVNTLSQQVPRDEDGKIIMSDDVIEKSLKAVQDISDEIPQLKGYVDRKPLPFKDSIEESFFNVAGRTTFSVLTIEYNDYMYPLHIPRTIAHEAGHARGFGREDECDFIGYYACINSDDPILQYSGYMGMLSSLDYANWNYEDFLFEYEDLTQEIFDDWDFAAEVAYSANEEYTEREDLSEEEAIEVFNQDKEEYNERLIDNGVEEGIASYQHDLFLAVGLFLRDSAVAESLKNE